MLKSIRQAQAFGSEAAQARRDPEYIEGQVQHDKYINARTYHSIKGA